jgi:hypothetical protein
LLPNFSNHQQQRQTTEFKACINNSNAFFASKHTAELEILDSKKTLSLS